MELAGLRNPPGSLTRCCFHSNIDHCGMWSRSSPTICGAAWMPFAWVSAEVTEEGCLCLIKIKPMGSFIICKFYLIKSGIFRKSVHSGKRNHSWNRYQEYLLGALSHDNPHSSPLARRISWTEEPGGLQSMGSLRVGHDWVTSLSLFTFMHWRRQWQPTPVFLPGESQGRQSQVGCCLWGRTESDMTEVT